MICLKFSDFSEQKKICAAYCRVSTDSDDQANSFENQKKYFERFIAEHKNWILYRIYADSGLTGTSTKKRAAFNQMMDAANLQKFDLILTKEVSRFARNTLDTLSFTRMLKEKGIGVYFLLDNIYSLDSDAELRLTIMASLAQEESRKTSERVKWGQKRQMEKGVVFGRDMLGYRVIDGKMQIEPKGAETVRLIYDKFVFENKGASVIARELAASGIPTFTGKKVWQHSVILKLLANEKYCGDLVQKKTFTPNYLTHEKRYNHGDEPLVFTQNHHEPIVSRKIWNAAQERLNKQSPQMHKMSKHTGRYPLSGKIFCGFCGKPFAARTKHKKDGSISPAWQCRNPDCKAPHVQIRNADFLILLQKVVDAFEFDRSELIGVCRNILDRVFDGEEQNTMLVKNEKLCRQNERLLDLYLTGVIDKEHYLQRKAQYEKQTQICTSSEKDWAEQRTEEILEKIQKLLTESESAFYRGLLDRITVFGREKTELRFATGLTCTAFIE